MKNRKESTREIIDSLGYLNTFELEKLNEYIKNEFSYNIKSGIEESKIYFVGYDHMGREIYNFPQPDQIGMVK